MSSRDRWPSAAAFSVTKPQSQHTGGISWKLGPSWRQLGPPWGRLGAVLGPSCGLLGVLFPTLPPVVLNFGFLVLGPIFYPLQESFGALGPPFQRRTQHSAHRGDSPEKWAHARAGPDLRPSAAILGHLRRDYPVTVQYVTVRSPPGLPLCGLNPAAASCRAGGPTGGFGEVLKSCGAKDGFAHSARRIE